MMNGDNMATFEQYPDYAMMTNAKGERDTKPWVSGPSPLAMGLLAGGLGILSQPEDTSGWITEGGGFDPTNIARGGLLGLQSYQQQNQNLQDQRKEFYTQRRAEEDQALSNRKAKQEFEDRQKRQEQFPILIEKLRGLKNPAISAKLPALMTMGQGNINTGYSAAANLLSAATGKQYGEPYVSNGLVLQKRLGPDGLPTDEVKFLAQETAKTSNKIDLSSNLMRGTLIESSSNMKLFSSGKSVEKPGLNPLKYNSMYREKQRNDKDVVKTTSAKGETTETHVMRRFDDLLDPRVYAIQYGMSPEAAEKLGIPVDVEDTTTYSSVEKQSITAAKDFAKVGIISLTEDSLAASTYSPLTSPVKAYANYLAGGQLPITPEARTYEVQALTGARMFGYLFSGATVKDDENRAMRQVLYTYPGDSVDDAKRKRRFRIAIINMYKEYIPKDVSKALFKKVLSKQINNPEQLKVAIKKEKAKKSTSKKVPVLTKTESAKILEQKW